jgi:pre-rRNA-processing protein TSR3
MKNHNFKGYRPKIYCLHYRDCDPKKCTALKLKKFNLLEIIKKINGELNNSIILNPFARTKLTYDDREIIIKYGLIVIDCSWNKLFDLKKFDLGISRRLPPLLAANPTNYGKWEKLSSVEAITAALFITGFCSYALLLLSKFQWGNQFKILNKF